MAPTYTITAADVAAVSADSGLVEGVEFDWGSTPRKIKTPATVGQVDAQWIVDHCRFAEATHIGLAQPAILTASGKIQTGTNPITGNPELTSITPVLLNDWVVETQKSSGPFFVIDIYNPTYTAANNTPPYINVSGVDIRYIQTRNGTIQQISGGDAGGFTSSDRATLTTAATNTATLTTRLSDARATALDLITPMSNWVINLIKGLGRFPGVTATQKDPTDSATGSLTTSDAAIAQTITKNPDGSITIENNP